MTSTLPRTLFIGQGTSGVCWYRVALPATFTGADWLGAVGHPPELAFATGSLPLHVSAEKLLPGYDVVVLQQPYGPEWLRLVRRLQAGGSTVLYEVDDYLHAVRKHAGHSSAASFGAARLRAAELVMRACDGLICSTPWLAARYRGFNPNVWVCRNGLDLGRYDLLPPAREGVVFGWAGGTGHGRAIKPWLLELMDVMQERPATRFVSIGQRFADIVGERLGEQRALSIPFGALETYPAAMTQIDIALAPVAPTNFFRAKSDLRWLEASALGIPTIADPVVYPEIEDGVTGLHAATPAQARAAMCRLADDPGLRRRIGTAARDHVRRHRDMRVMARQWVQAISEAAGRTAAAA